MEKNNLQNESYLTNLGTVKPVLGDHSKIGKMKVFKTGGSLLQVESIAESKELLTCIKLLSVLKTYFVVFF